MLTSEVLCHHFRSWRRCMSSAVEEHATLDRVIVTCCQIAPMSSIKSIIAPPRCSTDTHKLFTSTTHLADACEVEAGEGRLHAGHSGCVHVTPAHHAAARHILQHKQHAAADRVVNNLPPFKPILSKSLSPIAISVLWKLARLENWR